MVCPPRAVAVVFVLLLGASVWVPAATADDPWPQPEALCDAPHEVGGPCISPYAYADYLFAPPDELPDDYAGGDVWKYSGDQSGFPELDADPRELHGVTGMSVDRAWRDNTGRPDTTIAILDSGIRWRESDLRLKAQLNTGELPIPAGHSNFLHLHDADFNGVVNVDDYAHDPRVSDLNGNGHLDAGDLIRAFSDGTDDDGNGFIDDISGWNFLDDTNDPFDEVDYGHGTGEAEDSTGEPDNGDTIPGTCPNCRFIPLRVGQSFIAHEEDYAQAVLYAVDIGASVIQVALGTVNNHPLSREANRYAYTHGVALIVSAADEAAYHHNYPSAHDYTINLNSIRTGAETNPMPRSFLYVNGCTNIGGNVWASISSTSCSSEAAGRGAGIAGLIVSHARHLADRGVLTPHPDSASWTNHNPLSSGEVKQLFRAGADDIDLSTKREVFSPVPTVRYASHAGWDQATGYGRMNAARALDLLDDGIIPPEVAITSPGWWSTHPPLQDADIHVVAETSLHRAPGTHTATLAYGCGKSPTAYHELATQDITGHGAERLVWHIDARTIADACHMLPLPPLDADAFTAVLRVQVTNPDGVTGEDRRSIHLPMDPTLADGWPRLMEGSGEASVDIVDLDGDGIDDLVVPTSGGLVHAYRLDGSELHGWPAATDLTTGIHPHQSAFRHGHATLHNARDSISHGGTAIADVDGDGDLEVFATTYSGRVYGWDHHGARLAGFPVTVDPRWSEPENRDRFNSVIEGIAAAPVLADLDGDGDRELIVAAMDRHVYAWHHDATQVTGFPVHLADPAKVTVDPVTHRVTPLDPANTFRGAQIVSTTAVGDLDGDGDLEIVVGANEHYREELAVSATTLTPAALGLTGLLPAGNGRLFAIEADGTYVPGFPLPVPVLASELLPYVGEGIPGSPALADLDGDGADEIVISSTAGPVMVYRGDGSGFYGDGPDGKPIGISLEAVGPASGAVDTPHFAAVGSGAIGHLVAGAAPQIVTPTVGLGRALDVLLPGEQVVSQDYTAAWDSTTGQPLPSWPRPNEDLQFLTTPAILQVDRDPLAEVVVGSGGYLVHAWDASGAEAVGFPKSTQGWVIATPAAGDLDGDGKRELATITREGWLFVWHLDALASAADPWPSDHHDHANTGRYGGAAMTVSDDDNTPSPLPLLVPMLVAGLVLPRAGRQSNRRTS